MTIRYLALAATVLMPQLAAAQDLVGFDRASYGKVVLSQTQSALPGMEFELSVGSYNNESIQNYSPDSVFAVMGRSVGRLDILTDAGIFPCTAFIVDDRHLLTNYHCVPGVIDNPQTKATRIEAVKFVAGYTQQGVEEGTASYTVNPVPVEAHKDLDYALLEVLGDPSADYGTLRLSPREAKGGDPYWVIGHPMGEAQRISREQCRANVPPLSGVELLHTCDTLPGNSGSPVIDASLQMVVGLHHAGSKKDSVNFAIPMGLILERSSYLTAALDSPSGERPGAGTRTDAPVDPGSAEVALCDSLYQEAKTYAACFAYRAYANQCDGHPFVGFARAYMDDNCGGAPAPSGGTETAATTKTTPQPQSQTQPPAQTGPLRPWCANGRLNATEATICQDAYLAGLDGQLEAAYNASWKHGPTQAYWLRNTRDACGTDRSCIASAVTARISVLKAEAIEKSGGSGAASGTDYVLSNDRCYITVASRQTLDEARSFVFGTLADPDKVRIFQSNNGYYGITYGIAQLGTSDWILSQWKAQGLIPQDSYCSSGSNFVAEVAWSEGGDSPAPERMYVDNNDDGGLNVRTGPGTNYDYFTELEPGTEVEIIGGAGSWSNIRFQGGTQGWVYTPLLTSARPYVRQCWGNVVNLGARNTYNAATGAGFLSVRSEPNARTGEKLTELYAGDRVKVLARRSGWARVYCVSGACERPYFGDPGAKGWSSELYLSISCS
ncbi:trypsin-like peptidase domain-containing protein [Anianabacter salinae]|uniref:trypsin-like peptidase domain-containing protein n=1 Tax=Anianabacter salinae TaxID=2851023 RepID=UPI00225DE77F|nr:trypsin-like peptidase domain-containing protein [Anianabacter salinae]MBV0914193.1 trypsin-like peptidase domain-containing protein [Anianabacter salinae]